MYHPENSSCLIMTLSTMIAGYGYYYEFSVTGDTYFEDVPIISEETSDTAGASVLVRKGSVDSGGSRDIVVNIHSPTNNALGLSFSYNPKDEEFLMPSIDQVINSVIVGYSRANLLAARRKAASTRRTRGSQACGAQDPLGMSWAICPLRATPYSNERPGDGYADVSALYTFAPR